MSGGRSDKPRLRQRVNFRQSPHARQTQDTLNVSDNMTRRHRE